MMNDRFVYIFASPKDYERLMRHILKAQKRQRGAILTLSFAVGFMFAALTDMGKRLNEVEEAR